MVRRQRYLPVILWRRRKRRSTMFLWIRRKKSAGHQAHSVRPDAHAIEVLTEQPRRAGDFPAQEDRMLGWRWNLAGMFGKRQTARRKKRGRISVRGCCALPGFVDSKNEEKTERNAGYLVVSHSGGGMLRQGTRKGIRRTPANRGMRAHRIVKSLDISEDVCHGLCP